MSDAPPRLCSLLVLGGALHGRRVDLDEAVDEVLIGSDPDCRFHLDLPTISPIHARIWMDLQGATVHDTHSPRGVFLNMERVVGEAPLQEGDMLWLGPPQEPGSLMIQCRFEERAVEEPVAPSAEAPPEEAGLDELVGPEPPTEAPAVPRPAPPPPPAPPSAEDEPLGVIAEEEEIPRWRAAAEAEALVAAETLEPLVTTESPEPLEPVVPEAGGQEAPTAPEPSLEMPVGSSAAGFDDFLIEEPGGSAPPPSPAPSPQDEFSVGGFAPAWPEAAPAEEAKPDEFFIQQPSTRPAAPPLPGAPPSPELSSHEDPFFLPDTPAASLPAAAPPPGPADDSAFFLEDAAAVPPAAAEEPPAFVAGETPFPSEAGAEPATPSFAAPPLAPSPPAAHAPIVAPPPAARPLPAATTGLPPSAPTPATPGGPPAKAAAEPPTRPQPAAGPAPTAAPSAPAPPVTPARRRPEGPGVSQRLEAAPRPTPRADRSIPPRARGGSRVPVGRLAGLGVAAVAVVGLGVFLARGYLSGARLEGIEPTRARVGQTVTLTGQRFAPQPEANVVLFGDKPGRVVQASETRLQVEVPDVATGGKDTRVRVRVRGRGSESKPLEIAVYQGPTIHGISTDVALPGDEVTLAGTGWGLGVQVRFGTVPAEILQSSDSELKVRVPPLPGGPGTAAPVVVSVGAAESNPLPFFVGRLPLVLGVEPKAAAPGDVVTVAGRGFRRGSGHNDVQIAGARALVVSAIDTELKVEVPRLAGEGDRPLEVRVAGSETVGQSTLAVSALADPVELHFFAEPFDAAPGRDHAVLATGLGPAFVVAAAGGRSAAERAVEAQRRLNDGAGSLKATRGLNLEVRNLETAPALAVVGRPELLLEVTEQDAAAYNEDWTRLRGRGGPVTRARLARWWEALGRDLVLMLVRGETPQYAAALAPEGRALGELFQLAQKGGGFGVPRKVVAEAKPGLREALRLLAFRVPPSVRDVSPAGTATPEAPVGPPPLRLEGTWAGSEREGGTRRWVTITFTGNGGRLSYEGTVTLTIPLESLDRPQKDTVRYSLQFRGGMRHYVGKWDGQTLSGKISSDPAGTQPLGTFELRPR